MPATLDFATEVIDICRQAAEANRDCAARRGNVVCLTPDNADDLMIVADLHGNRLNFEKLLGIADLDGHPRRHLIMQEVCHGGPEYPGGDGGCMSHLLLEDCIRLKTEYPERFHFLLSNHELAELGDFPICKSRRMLNLQFRCGINEMYGDARRAGPQRLSRVSRRRARWPCGWPTACSSAIACPIIATASRST